jgi:tetratricopeptide (TPR) repeat protein
VGKVFFLKNEFIMSTLSSLTSHSSGPTFQDALNAYNARDLPKTHALCHDIVRNDPSHSDALHLLATIEQHQGNPILANSLCDKAINLAPDNPFIRLTYVKILCSQQNYSAALAHCNTIIKQQPNLIDAYIERSTVLQYLQNHQAALKDIEHAIQLAPEESHFLFLRGNLLHILNQANAALNDFNALLEKQPQNVSALINRGVVFQSLGQHQAAIDDFTQALALPDTSQRIHALYNRAISFQNTGNFAAAIQDFQSVVKSNPHQVSSLFSLAICQQLSEDLPAAIATYDIILRLNPTHVDALSNQGLAYHNLGEHKKALATYNKILKFQPKHANTFFNCGNVFRSEYNYPKAKECFARAVKIDPDHIGALLNYGNVFRDLGEPHKSLPYYDRILSQNPNDAEAHLNKGLNLLLLENFKDGWVEYESRWQSKEMPNKTHEFKNPRWQGESLEGKTILLYSEQGLGDTIHFCRYLSFFENMQTKVILWVKPELKRLISQFSFVELISDDTTIPYFDYHCPLLSLARLFNTDLNSIPNTVPYLKSIQDPQPWINQFPERPRIGVVWSGSTIHKNDYFRSIPLETFIQCFPTGLDIICLQKELRTSDQKTLEKYPNIHFIGHQLNDLDDTTALIQTLDLVITVDSSVAHLAGALAKPVWILLPGNPDWRWLLRRTDSPWYPTAHLYRQPKLGNWTPVIRTIQKDLKKWLDNFKRTR